MDEEAGSDGQIRVWRDGGWQWEDPPETLEQVVTAMYDRLASLEERVAVLERA